MSNQQKSQTNQNQSQIRIQDNLPGAEYANLMQVGHNKEEFLLTFMNIVGPTGRVCSKVIISPGHMKRMISALEDNLKKYESQFGNVEQAEAPSSLGFKA